MTQYDIVDAHTHFFSYTWFEHFYHLGRKNFAEDSDVGALAELLGWELPPKDPHALGNKWLAEQEKYGIQHQVLFASKVNDAEYMTAAVRAHPDRFTGFVMLDPTEKTARARTHYSIHILGMKGLLLFPAMHHFHVHDEAIFPIFEEAFLAGIPVFIHFGRLSIPIFQKLGLPDNIDLRYSNPLDLDAVAAEYHEVNFIIPHFGCGRFDEALAMAEKHDNIYLDTSSSNAWIQAPLTLQDVFARTLDTIGPTRILFGTDSSAFPRGWRKDVFDTQLAILDNLQVSDKDKALIFGKNIKRLLGLK